MYPTPDKSAKGRVNTLSGSYDLDAALGQGVLKAVKRAAKYGQDTFSASAMDTDRTAAGNVLTTKYNPAASQRISGKKRPRVDKKFQDKVKKVISADIGTIQQLKQCDPVGLQWESWVSTPTGAQKGQTTNSLSLFSGAGTGPFHNDTFRIFQSINTASERETATLNLKSGVIDIVFLNDQAVSETLPGAHVCDIDIYEAICIRDVPLSLGVTPHDIVSAGMVDYTTPYTTGTAQIRSTSLGATPFQAPLFSRHFKMYGKQKLFLAPGDSSHVEYKHSFNNKKVPFKRAEANLALAGITRVYIVVANNVGRQETDFTGGRALLMYQTKRLTYESEYNMIPQANIDNA